MVFTTYKFTMIKKNLYNQLKNLNFLIKVIDFKQAEKLLEDCINTIKKNKQIITSALGKNVPICEKFIGTLNSVGIDGHFVHTNSAIHGDLGVIDEGDLVILLSKSGNTEETLKLAKLISKLKIKTWLITCNDKAKTKQYVNETLILPLINEGDPWDLIPNNSTISFLFLLQGLAMTIIEKLNISIDVFKRNHPGGDIGNKLKKIR